MHANLSFPPRSTKPASAARQWLHAAVTGALPIILTLLVLTEMPAVRPAAAPSGRPPTVATAGPDTAVAGAVDAADALPVEQPPTF
jgi:hypothetical protein